MRLRKADSLAVSYKKLAILLLLVAAPALTARAYLMHVLHIVDRPEDYLGGYASSLAVAFFFLFVALCLRPRAQRLFCLGGVTLLAIGHYGNFEHVRELDSALSFMFAHFLLDPEFVGGSALQITQPILFLALMLSPALLLLSGKRLVTGGTPLARTLCLGLATAFVALTLVNNNTDTRSWRLFDPIQENVMGLAGVVKNLAASAKETGDKQSKSPWSTSGLAPLADSQKEVLASLFKPDLSGEKWASQELKGNRRPNVLLVMIESMSGAYLPSFSGAWGDAYFQMPQFDAYAKEHGVLFKNFVFNAKKTNRGEYSMLCGDYDNIASAPVKMNVYIDSNDAKPCLAHYLKEAGYETVYLQSANLTFMNKDLFMPKAGFERYLGLPFFTQAHDRNGWGVDDRTLFEHAYTLIEDLEKAAKPWFLAVLNTGTHHPGLPPPGWEATYDSQPKAAYAYADEQLTAFLKKLTRNGIMDHTLAMVTGDEARTSQRGSEAKRVLTTHWGHLTLFGNSLQPTTKTELYAQSDLSLSVLDYLDLIEPSVGFYGRSLFRTHKTPRVLPFGVLNTSTVWLYRESTALTSCHIHSFICHGYDAEGWRLLFQRDLKKDPTIDVSAESLFLKYFLAKNEKEKVSVVEDQIIELAASDDLQLSRKAGTQKILFRALGPIDAGHLLRTTVEVEVMEGEVRLTPIHQIQKVKTEGKITPFEMDRCDLQKGDRLVIDFSSRDEAALSEFLFYIKAKSLSANTTLRFHKAQVKVSNSDLVTATGVITKKISVEKFNG